MAKRRFLVGLLRSGSVPGIGPAIGLSGVFVAFHSNFQGSQFRADCVSLMARKFETVAVPPVPELQIMPPENEYVKVVVVGIETTV